MTKSVTTHRNWIYLHTHAGSAYDVICLHPRNVNIIVISQFLTDMTDGDIYDTPHSILRRSNSGTESSVSDSDSSVAPTDFQLSVSFECSTRDAAVSVALERCWLCLGSRRSFYCKQCVRAGDFAHSRPLQQPFQPLRPLADLER